MTQISAVSLSVRRYIASQTDIKAFRFIISYLLPPPKRHVLAYLGIPVKSGDEPEPPIPIVRKAEVDVSQLDLAIVRTDESEHDSSSML
jgi:primary-amine oxidase